MLSRVNLPLKLLLRRGVVQWRQSRQKICMANINYTPIHQVKQTGQKGGGIALFLLYNFDFKIIKRGNICNDDIEYLAVEILRNKDKNIIFLVFTGLREVILNFFWMI